VTKEIFREAKLKVEHANSHIRELNESIVEFANDDICRFVTEKDTDTDNYILKCKMIKSLPEKVTLIIGDAIHNLRSALDLMAWELVELCGGKPDKDISFPIVETQMQLEATMKNKKIKIIGTDNIKLMCDVIKPYKGGNNNLFGLHRLDIADKHRTLIPTAHVGVVTHATGFAGGTQFVDCTFSVDPDGSVHGILAMPEDFNFYITGQQVIWVFFSQTEVFKEQHVLRTLDNLTLTVSDVIQKFEKLNLPLN